MKAQHRHGEIAARLRARILSGTWAPGTRLPSYDHFEREFSAARTTMLYAIRQLKEAGLVESRGRGGLFVARHPPHLHRYAMVYADTFADGNLYLNGFLTAVPQVESATGQTIEVFGRVRQGSANAPYQRLLLEHAQGRLGGILFLTRPSEFLDPSSCPILADPDLPRIAISAPVEPGVATYHLDACESVRLGTRLLRQAGVSRMGIIGLGWWNRLPDPRLIALETEPGMRVDEAWRLFTNGLTIFALARHLTRLLLDGDPGQVPDGILVLDDHLTAQVVHGVQDAGRTGTMRVVSTSNFPPTGDLAMPVTWIGHDPRRLLTNALRDLSAVHSGTPLPSLRTLAPECFQPDDSDLKALPA